MKASTEFEKAIQAYLEEAKKTYPNMSEALMQEGKNLTECCNYIIQEVQKKKVNAMTNADVFSLANEYYLSKEEIKTKKINCKVVVGVETGSSVEVSPAAPVKAKRKIPVAKPVDGKQLSLFELLK